MKLNIVLFLAAILYSFSSFSHGDQGHSHKKSSARNTENKTNFHTEHAEPLEPDSPFCDNDGDGVINEAELREGPNCMKSTADGNTFFAEKVISRMGLEKGELVLTIDDGPNPVVTPKILDLLKFYNIKATFFLTGSLIAGNEAILKRMLSEGHTIGNHTFSHDVKNITPITIQNEINLAHQTILNALGDAKDQNGNELKNIFLSRLLFRAPGLAWNVQKAQNLNEDKSNITYQYIGPIHANLGADAPVADWHCWRNDVDAKTCAEMYFKQIVSVGRGVVLSHDVHYDSEFPERNTYEMLVELLSRLDNQAGGITNRRGEGVWTFRKLAELPVLDQYDVSELNINKGQILTPINLTVPMTANSIKSDDAKIKKP